MGKKREAGFIVDEIQMEKNQRGGNIFLLG